MLGRPVGTATIHELSNFLASRGAMAPRDADLVPKIFPKIFERSAAAKNEASFDDGRG
jgi:hypothetical protein